MEKIKIDEENKKRIKKYIKKEKTFFGYEEDIDLLEQSSELTEKLAREVFRKVMNDAQRIRNILWPKENDEFREQIDVAFSQYDAIPKPEELEQYGFYEGSYSNMELDEIYPNMQAAFELIELDSRYYACRDLREIAKAAISSIDGIDKYKIELQPEAREELRRIQEELKALLAQNKTDIGAIQSRIDIYNRHAINIWNNYLTDVNDKDDKKFRYLAHSLTGKDFEGDFWSKYMSTSLITDNTMGLYAGQGAGLIIKPIHIVSANDKDTFTYNDRDEEDEIFNIRQPIKLPQEIEESCINMSIEIDGEILEVDSRSVYSEIVVDEYEIIGTFCIDKGERELNPSYERAKRIAKARGVPFKEIDITRYREDKGLEPIPKESRQWFCEETFYRLRDRDEKFKAFYTNGVRMFPSRYYEQFYERFMNQKMQEDFSVNDITYIIIELAEKDEQFRAIAKELRRGLMKNESEKGQEESRETGQSNSKQSQEKQWMEMMRDFSDEATEIEAYARRQRDFLHTISEVAKQTQENLQVLQEEQLDETKKGQRKADIGIGYGEK